MAITPWDDIKAQVGYDELPTEGKVDTINKYSQYVQEYYTQVEPRDEKEVGQASDEFVKIASQDALGDLGAVERGSAFLGNIYKGASGTFTSAFKAAALAQQAIGESLGSYDDNTPVTERDIYKIAQNIDESVKQTTGIEDPRLRNDFINTLLPQGLGSALGFLGVAAAAAAAAPEAAVGAVGLGTAAALGAATNAGSTYEEARQAGANEFTSRASAIAGGVVGLTEAIPLGGLAGRLTAGIAKRSILRGVVEGASEEFLQETGSQMANNFIASKFAGYDPNRGIMDGALQSGAVGLVTGGLIGGGVNAITRDNEAFYADKLSDELKSKADLAASLTPERLTQITEAARNANTTTRQRIDIETGETETTSDPKTVFGDRLAGEVPDIGNNPAINSVPLGRSISQDADGNNTETFTFHTPQGLLWEAEFKTGEPVKVRDVTDDSPLLNPITSPADPRTATRSQFTGRIISPTSSIAKEFGLETEQEMDRRLIAEAQREMQLGRVTDQTLLPDNQIIPESVSRDDRGVARQVVLNNEIERLYKIREGVLARQILVGQNPNAGTTEYDPNAAREVIRYDSEGNRIENKQETSQRVARLNRMIGMRETELRGLTARPEGYILASERNTPPSASQKLSLVQGFQNLWNSISSPALRNAITFEVGDITPLIESGQVPKGAVAYYKRASDGRKAMIFLSDKLATMPMARREMIHELGHAFWDTLPAGVQAEIRGLWKAETESRTGALFDEFGGLRAEVSPRVMDSVQEFFSERLAWTNDQWAKGISEKNSVMDKAGRAFRNLLDRFLRYTGHGERLNLEFRSFLDQGDRFKGLRTRVEQALEAGRAAINEEPQPSIRGLAKYEQLFDYTRNNPDGFTVDPISFNVPTTGYIVAPSKNTEGEMPLNMSREEGIKAFRSYLLSNDDIFRAYGIGQRLANVEGAGAYFGGWLKTTENNEALPKDQYKFVYDISFVLDNKTDALYVAENGKQDAIFDISAGQTIDTAPAVRDLRASGLYTPSDRGRLQELGGKVDYLAGRKGSLRAAVESIRRAVNPAVQAGRIQSQGRSLQEAGSPEVVASTRGAVSVESVPLRRDGVRLEKPSVKEVANFLQQRSIDRIQKPLTKDTPADVRMAQYLINTWSEVSYQLQQEDTGMTWYSQDIEQMESDLAQLYPESIDSIKEKMVLFKAMLVGNSFSQTPKAETLTTMRIWDSSNQQFPVKPRQDDGKGWTVRGGTVEIYLNRINRLVAEKGEKGAADWLLSKHPIKELREYNPNVGGKQDDLKYGSMIFGQKGGAYHLNMNGNYDVLTADLHFSRMWNRMMGTVLDANGEIIQAPTPAELKIQDQAVRFAADKLGLSVAELQAVSWVYEIGLWKDLGAKIGYYKHSDGTAKLLKERGIQRREVVPDSRAIEERRQTALSRANALSDGRDTQQVLPEEVRASTRGQTRSILNKNGQFLYHYTNIGRNFGSDELVGKTAREALLYIISKEGENRSNPNRVSFLSGSTDVDIDLKKWNKQYERTLSIAKMLSRSEFDNLDSDRMRSGRLGDRAYRSGMGYIGIGYNGINLGVLVHEIAHTITSDQINKYTLRHSGSYASKVRAALASSDTPEPIKRIIRLYQSTLSQLNLTDQYLDGIKYKRDPNPVYVSMAVSRPSQRARNEMDLPSGLKISLSLNSTDGRSSAALKKAILKNHSALFPNMRSMDVPMGWSELGDVALYIPENVNLASAISSIIGGEAITKTSVFDRVKEAMLNGGGFAISSSAIAEVEVGGGRGKISPISNDNPDRTTRAGGDYAFGNLNEFIAEAFSNGSFQEVLETLDGDQKSSLWRDLVEAIASLLGITDTTMMFSIMDATFEIAEMSNWRETANTFNTSDIQASTRGAQPRNAVIQQAANDFFEGRISREELNRISEEQKPARPVTSIPVLTDDEARSALDAGKQGMYGAARTLPEGTPVGLRIDIPSFNRTRKYVITVHNKADGNSKVGKVIGYDRIAAVSDAKFFNASEKRTLQIAAGVNKTPLATVEGKYIPIADAPAGLLENYQQVGFDPERHSYFYSKQNGNPVISADEAILIGNTVFVKGAVEGNKGDFLFSTRGEQAQRILEPVISFGRQQLRTGGALPYDIFRMTEQRGFNVNEKLLRAQNAVSDIEAAVKRSYAKSLDQLPEAEIARINEGLQNPLARAKLPTDVASAVGNARNLIDSLTQDLLRSGAISEDLKPVLEANKGVYLNRSYEKWENPNYKNPFNTLPKQVQNKLVTTVTSYLHNKYANAYAKEQSLSRGEVAINPDSGTYQADYQAGLAKARSGGVTKAEVDGQIEYLASPETDSPFGQIGSGLTKDLSIITARKNIPEEIRMLWGEIKDPRVNFLKSVQKMSGFLEAHNMLKGMRDAGMNKIFFTTPRTGFTTKLLSDGSRTASPLNMFIDGMKNDVYTSEEISTALRNTFGGRAKAQDFLGKMGELYLKANGFSKFAKTVLSVQTQARNLLGNGSFLVANGYIFSPDGITALNKLKTLALPSAGTQLGINKSKEFRDYNAKLTRLGILGQSVFANEMESYFKDANVNTAADFLDNHVTKGLKAIARGATSLYQLGDAIPKIVAFEVELSRLRKAYPTQPLSKLEPMAADKVLNLLPTYSRIPRLGNVLRSQPFVGAFISFPLEVVRTGYNLLGTINDELRSDNPAIRQAGAYRLAGTMMASIGFSAVAAGIAAAMGIDDDEDMAIRKLDAPWDKYSTKLYLGRDEKGNVNQVNMSYVDPYNYFRDPIIALIKRDGTWDQKLLESVKTAFQPLYGEQILSSKILDITRNTKGTTGGRVYNPEADLASKASAISAHMFDAFNIGTFTSSIRIYKGLTGQVTQTGRAYDPALETIATLTGQRVVSLDPRQSLGFAARKFSNRLNDATGIFTAAYYDRSNVSNEARMEAYKQMSRSRKEIFNDTAGTISAAMKLGVSRGEVMRILKEQGVSMDNSRALLSGLVAVYKPAKREMKGDAIRFRQQVYAGQ